MSEQAPTASSSAELFGSDRMWGLKELAPPDPVSWWPQTPGWYVLAVIALIALVHVLGKLYRRHQRGSYRREGIAALNAMTPETGALEVLPLLLRKSALHAARREDVAALRGRQWIDWLNGSAGRDLFTETDAKALDDLAYGGGKSDTPSVATRAHLLAAGKQWMRLHRAAV